MRVALICLLGTLILAAQQPREVPDLRVMTDRLQAAIEAGDWKTAAELSTLVKGLVRDVRNRATEGTNREQVDAIMGWLPADTETLVVAAEPFTIRELNHHVSHDALSSAQAYVLGLMGVAEKGELWSKVQGRTLSLAVLAARKFGHHSPGHEGLGMIAYQGCAAYSFAQPADTTPSRRAEEAVIGYPTWISMGSQHEERRDAKPLLDTYFASQPKPGLLLICNDRDFLSETLSRMTAHQLQSRRAFPPSLAELKEVDRSAPLWGLRRFLPERAESDPTHPANDEGSDPQASGMVIQVGSPSGTVKARMITKSKADPWKSLSDAGDFQGKAHTRQLPNGVWEISTDTTDQEITFFAVFALMAMLGFAVLL